jgi:high-affinity nickel-transport protein
MPVGLTVVMVVMPMIVIMLVAIPVFVTQRVCGCAVRSGHHESPPGQDAIPVRHQPTIDVGGQRCRLRHAVLVLGKCRKHAGREHVPGHSAQGIEMQVDHARMMRAPAALVHAVTTSETGRNQDVGRLARLACLAHLGSMPPTDHRPAARSTSQVVAVLLMLLAANLAAWIWAFSAFEASPVLIGSALLAWGFGLRHAVDADHIAAIDNVTRRMMQEGRRPIGVGLFFSLGHSTVVVLASLAILLARDWFAAHAGLFATGGALVGTLVSAGFLLLIGGSNLLLLISLLRRRTPPEVGPQGGLSRLLRPLFRRVGSSQGMFWLGLLFGLGFDTATEIGVLSIAATSVGGGHAGWSVMAYPALFTAGMSLVDTLDGILMLGAYGWAMVKPARKRGYNIAITAGSVLIAFGVGLVEILGLLSGRERPAPEWIVTLNDHTELAGALAVAGFALLWVAALGASVLRARPALTRSEELNR